jgi:hypothetical protein
MSTQGPLYATIGADSNAVGTRTWYPATSTLSYCIATSDYNDCYVEGTGSSQTTSHYLKATGFGFTIPAGATINGILVAIQDYDNNGNGNVIESEVKIIKSDGSIGTTNKSTGAALPPVNRAYVSYGGAADLWGETWAYSDINDTHFGVAFSIKMATSTESGYVDTVRITITYTAVTQTILNRLYMRSIYSS